MRTSALASHPPAVLFYIVTPSYVRTSAGIRCLHLLCHHLNLTGREAFLLPDPATAATGRSMRTCAELRTPLLDGGSARLHARQGRVPVVVMPETVAGNPYGARCILRYAMHFPGFLGGDTVFAAGELRFGFSRSLAEAIGAPGNVLFIPSINLSVFKPPEASEGPVERRGACFYADKFRKVHGGVPSAITHGAVEIVRSEPGEQTPAEIAALFQRSTVFYSYENTALAIEAVLCGCPAVFLPNPWLTSVIADAELGREGYGWGSEAGELDFARRTVGQGARNYLKRAEAFPAALDGFVDKAAAHAAQFAPGPALRPLPAAAVPLGKALTLALSRRLPLGLAKRVAELTSTLGVRRLADILWADLFERSPRPEGVGDHAANAGLPCRSGRESTLAL